MIGILLTILVSITYLKRDKTGDDHDDVSLVETVKTDMQLESSFVVHVDDNFNYMDDDESYEDSRYATMAQAEQRCIEIIDNFLGDNYRTSTPKEIIDTWFQFGPDPYCKGSSFSASGYVREQAFKIGRSGLSPLPDRSIDFSNRPFTVTLYEPDQFVIRETATPTYEEIVIASKIPNLVLEMAIDSAFLDLANTDNQSNMLEEIYNTLREKGWEIQLVR